MEIDKLILQFMWKRKEQKIAKKMVKKKRSRSLHSLIPKHGKTIVMKTLK